MIAHRKYSIWTHEIKYDILLLEGNHWKKSTYTEPTAGTPLLLQELPIVEKPASNTICEKIFSQMLAENLFTIEDDNALPACTERKVIKDGKESIVPIYTDDTGGDILWIITPLKQRHLFYTAPSYLIKYCPNESRASAIKIIELFNKEWPSSR
ncbi:MAG: hypothetical protein JWQ79_3258 [Mucilaginibacter sp.]|nr:hypothetical protein [Mucilaginibacter sp.]